MNAITPEILARRLFDALSAGDFSTWEASLAPGFTASYPGLRGNRSRAEALAFNQVFPKAFPDLQFTLTASARAGDMVFLRLTATGTHLGALVTAAGTLPPAGRKGTVDLVMVATIRDGKIQREETYWNVPDLIEQLTERAAA